MQLMVYGICESEMKSMPPRSNNVAKRHWVLRIFSYSCTTKSHAINLPWQLAAHSQGSAYDWFLNKGYEEWCISGWRNRVNLPEYELQLRWDPIVWSCDCNDGKGEAYAVVVLGEPLCMPSIKQPRSWVVWKDTSRTPPNASKVVWNSALLSLLLPLAS
jgi:hypothetical protein